MEKEYMLQWLEGVQTATEESDGGLFSPDHYIPSPSSSKDPTHISFLQNERMNNRSPTQSYSTSTRLSSQVPQDPITASKKATFKLTRSKTLASEATDSLGNKKMGRPLSVDIPECDEHENSTEDLLKAQRTQSSPLPLPASSPDMVVPTIALARISPRKPLVRQSSSTFLSDLKIQAPLLSKLPVPSVDLPKRGKSAPNSPNIEKDRKGLEWKLGIMKHANKCYSQGDMRQLVDSATSDGDSGSCVAERGEMSDSSSGGLNIPWSMDEGFPSQRLSPRDEIKHGGMASPVSKKVVLCEAASVEHDITAENRLLTEKLQQPSKLPLETTPKLKRPPLMRQATLESTPSPSELSPQSQFVGAVEMLDKSTLSSLPAKRSSLESSIAVKYHNSASDACLNSGGHPSPPGMGSLTFHDHHLVKKSSDHHLCRKGSLGMVRSTTVEEYSGGRNPDSPTCGSSTTLHQLSSLLSHKRLPNKHSKSKSTSVEGSDRQSGQKWKTAASLGSRHQLSGLEEVS